MNETFDTLFTNARANLANFMEVKESELPQETIENLEQAINMILANKFLFECEKLMQIALAGFVVEIRGKSKAKNPLALVNGLKDTKELSMANTSFRYNSGAHCVEAIKPGGKYLIH